MKTFEDITDPFVIAYLECALWASTDDDDGTTLDSLYSLDDLSEEAIERAEKDCHEFVDLCEREGVNPYPEYPVRNEWSDEAKSGHDFFLTRNGHGAGYWDRGLGDIGDKLTALAHSMGETDLYSGDDGKLYFY